MDWGGDVGRDYGHDGSYDYDGNRDTRATSLRSDQSHSRSRSPRPHRHRHDRRGRAPRDSSAASTSKRRRVSPHSHHSHHSHRAHHHTHKPRHGSDERQPLPFGARHLSRWDLAAFEPLLAHYLDVQKQIRLADLDEHEVRGRWKSFVGKWNRHELSDDWYEPQMTLRVCQAQARLQQQQNQSHGNSPDGQQQQQQQQQEPPRSRALYSRQHSQMLTPPTSAHSMTGHAMDNGGDIMPSVEMDDVQQPLRAEAQSDDSDDDYGPSLPASTAAASTTDNRHASQRAGPAIPTRDDLALRRIQADEDRLAARQALRLSRQADRVQQRERLEDLVPRAAAGTRERKLEKKRELNDKMRSFREPSAGGDEVGDDELMGGGVGGGGGGGGGGGSSDNAGDYRRMLAAMQRRRTEREVRREEEQRARDAELNARRAQYRAREEERMEVLRELARQRFGSGVA